MTTSAPRFVAYVRVSTQKQGASGLGLEAQQVAIAEHVARVGGELMGELVEVETGKGANALKKRPKLAEALALAKKSKATLVIAKLDRLARNVHFISGLMEAAVPFVALDMPEANKLTLHVMAAFAEHEARAISKRTKEALARAKERGTVMGAKVRENSAALNSTRREEGEERAVRLSLAIEATAHLSLRAASAALAAKGHVSASGEHFSATQMQRFRVRLKRVGALPEFAGSW